MTQPGQIQLTRADLRLAVSRGLDLELLEQVRQHSSMVGNRVLVDSLWLSKELSKAFVMGVGPSQGGILDAVLRAVDIPGNVMRMWHSKAYRDQVVLLMNQFDVDRVKMNHLCEDPFLYQVSMTQLLSNYKDDVMKLWEAYMRRRAHPFEKHAEWPGTAHRL